MVDHASTVANKEAHKSRRRSSEIEVLIDDRRRQSQAESSLKEAHIVASKTSYSFPKTRRIDLTLWPKYRRGRGQFNLKNIFALAVLLPLVVLIGILWYGGLPPSYHSARLKERALPQHHWLSSLYTSDHGPKVKENNDSAVSPEEKLLRFPDHLWGHGLNNVLQEALLQALLAQHTDRSFVFEDFVWSHLPVPYTLYDFSLRPTRVPMGAFLGGWIAGASALEYRPKGLGESEKDVNDSENARPRALGPRAIHQNRGSRRHGSSRPFSTSTSTKSTLTSTTSSPSIYASKSRLQSSTPLFESGVNREASSLASRSIPRLSVSAEHFEHICPPNQRIEVVYKWPWTSSGNFPGEHVDGVEIFQWWIDRLSRDDLKGEKCVVIREHERRIWDANFFGTSRPLSLFPLLRNSPVLRHFEWSPLVQHAISRVISQYFRQLYSNEAIHGLDSDINSSSASKQVVDNKLDPTLPGVVAVHLRRGDYKRHCLRLAQWQAGYMGWNRLVRNDTSGQMFETALESHTVVDASAHVKGSAIFTSRDGFDSDEDSAQDKSLRRQIYLKHCLPSIPEIVRRLHNVRDNFAVASIRDKKYTSSPKSRNSLNQVYILTNGWPSFIDKLRQALLADGWEGVISSDDIEKGRFAIAHNDDRAGGQRGFTREEKGVSAAIDMGIAERAEVFLGNGFSSLSANVVMLRVAKGLPNYSNYLL